MNVHVIIALIVIALFYIVLDLSTDLVLLILQNVFKIKITSYSLLLLIVFLLIIIYIVIDIFDLHLNVLFK